MSRSNVAAPGNVLPGQELPEGIDVQSARHSTRREQHLDLGAENEILTVVRVVERLDPDVVASQHDLPASAVEQRDREHAVQALREVDAHLLLQVNDDFGIAARREAMPLALELDLRSSR